MSYIYDETTMSSVIGALNQMNSKLGDRIRKLEEVKAQYLNNINTVPKDLKDKRKNMRYEGEPRYTSKVADGNNFYDVLKAVGENYKQYCLDNPDTTMDFRSRPAETYEIKDTLTGEKLNVSIGELNQLRYMLIILGVLPAPVEKADRDSK